jgi:hypothetical protein
MALGSTHPLTQMSTRNLPGGCGRHIKADNLSAICGLQKCGSLQSLLWGQLYLFLYLNTKLMPAWTTWGMMVSVVLSQCGPWEEWLIIRNQLYLSSSSLLCLLSSLTYYVEGRAIWSLKISLCSGQTSTAAHVACCSCHYCNECPWSLFGAELPYHWPWLVQWYICACCMCSLHLNLTASLSNIYTATFTQDMPGILRPMSSFTDWLHLRWKWPGVRIQCLVDVHGTTAILPKKSSSDANYF